jgi:hypothetical protein
MPANNSLCQSARQLPKAVVEVAMKLQNLRNKVGRIFLAATFVAGIGLASSTAVQAQWPWGQDRYNRNDDWRYRNARNANILQVAVNQGLQDGLYTGSRDAQRRQSYNPQRSHFYRNGHSDNGGYGRVVNSYQFKQAYRQGFLRGYDQGYRQYAYNRNNGRYNNRWPW